MKKEKVTKKAKASIKLLIVLEGNVIHAILSDHKSSAISITVSDLDYEKKDEAVPLWDPEQVANQQLAYVYDVKTCYVRYLKKRLTKERSKE